MKIFTKDVEIEGRPGILVYSELYREGIWVLWDELEAGTVTIAEAKARVEELSSGEELC
jgi:hypothetical protein